MEGATLHRALAIGSEDAGIQCRHCGAIIYGIQVAHGAGGYLHYGCKIEVEAMQQRAAEEVRKRSEAKYELQLRRVVHKMSWSTARAKKVRRWHGGGVLGHCDSGCGGALEECSFVFQYVCSIGGCGSSIALFDAGVGLVRTKDRGVGRCGRERAHLA